MRQESSCAKQQGDAWGKGRNEKTLKLCDTDFLGMVSHKRFDVFHKFNITSENYTNVDFFHYCFLGRLGNGLGRTTHSPS